MKLKQERIILQSPDDASRRIKLTGKKDNWPLKFALLSAWMNRLTGNDGYLHAKERIEKAIYHRMMPFMAIVACPLLLMLGATMLHGVYDGVSKIALEDALQFMAIAISYTAVTVV